MTFSAPVELLTEVTKLSAQYPEIEYRQDLSPEEFYRDYVDRKSVVIRGVADRWAAMSRWTTDYFRSVAGDLRIKVKPGYLPDGNVDFMPLGSYQDIILEYEEKLRAGQAGPEDRPPYLHDIPMLDMCPALLADVEPFPVDYLPRWYRSRWWKFSQFFQGPTHSLTPLHFDSLETHNIFFQIVGRKRFILVAPEDHANAYVYKWRWSAVDAEDPDFDRHPRFEQARPMETTVGPGDILYMPPRTLHQVRSLDYSISFNIDWQTRGTALRGVTGLFRGMPLKNVYYNSVAAVGLWTGLPSPVLYPFYRSYLDYVS